MNESIVISSTIELGSTTVTVTFSVASLYSSLAAAVNVSVAIPAPTTVTVALPFSASLLTVATSGLSDTTVTEVFEMYSITKGSAPMLTVYAVWSKRISLALSTLLTVTLNDFEPAFHVSATASHVAVMLASPAALATILPFSTTATASASDV